MSSGTYATSDGPPLHSVDVMRSLLVAPPLSETELTAVKPFSTTVPIMVEKKRDREKKRRTDITKAIDALVQLLVKIDPSLIMIRNNQAFGIISSSGSLVPMNDVGLFQLPDADGTEAVDTSYFKESSSATVNGVKRRHRTSFVGDPVPLNRTDIIHHAARILEKIHKENQDYKKDIQHLKFLLAQHSAVSNYSPRIVPTWPLPYWNSASSMSMADHPSSMMLHQPPNTATSTLYAKQEEAPAHVHPAEETNHEFDPSSIDPLLESPQVQSKLPGNAPTHLSSSSSSSNSQLNSSSFPIMDIQQQLLLAQQQYQLQTLYHQQMLLYSQQQQQ